MINLKKTIFCLFGSCLLCSALTTIDCNSYLSNKFYDSLSSYQGANGDSYSGYDGKFPRSYARYDSKNHAYDDFNGWISGYDQCGNVDEYAYSKIVQKIDTSACCCDTAKSFQIQAEGGDYAGDGNMICPLWCVGIKNPNYGGNDLNNGRNIKNNSVDVYIRGLECVGPSAIHCSCNLPTLRFKTVPVALDDFSCKYVNGLNTVVFDGDSTRTTIPYFLSPDAFPPTVQEIHFICKSFLNYWSNDPDVRNPNFRNVIMTAASNNTPTANQNFKPTNGHDLKDKTNYWGNIPDNDIEYKLTNYLEKFRKKERIIDPYTGEVVVKPWSHLWFKDNEVIWQRDKSNDTKPGWKDMYWDADCQAIWTLEPEIVDNTGGNANILTNVDQQPINNVLKDPERPFKYGSEGSTSVYPQTKEIQGKNDQLGSQEKIRDQSSNKVGLSTTLPSSEEEKINTDSAKTTELSSSANATSDENGAALASQKSSSAATNTVSKYSASNSASTKTGSESISLIPVVLSGGTALILKKKKDD